jgi:hypothetical protein
VLPARVVYGKPPANLRIVGWSLLPPSHLMAIFWNVSDIVVTSTVL